MRPEQWTKNLIVFAGLFFGRKFSHPEFILVSLKIFAIFCTLSSASYLLNDILDRKEDRYHPDKSKRPIATGSLSINYAIITAGLLTLVGLLSAYKMSHELFLIAIVFLFLHVIYDLFLKHIAIIDVFAIAFAFILRLIAGVSVDGMTNLISSWILLCTFLLALFLAFCKRRAEIVLLLDNSRHHRRSLGGYSKEFLDQMITVVAGCAILSYSLYALSNETIVKHGTDKLKYTIPFVVYGMFRYLYLVNMKKGGANPEKILLKDVPFLLCVISYCLFVYLIIYR
jgi:4-hydroxybenzoate polyprenyltransferase